MQDGDIINIDVTVYLNVSSSVYFVISLFANYLFITKGCGLNLRMELLAFIMMTLKKIVMIPFILLIPKV